MQNIKYFSIIFLLLLESVGSASSPSRHSSNSVDIPRNGSSLSLGNADPKGKVIRRLKQLTGVWGRPTGHDFGDPSPPDFSEPGVVRIYTTSSHVLVWRDEDGESATMRFLRGVAAEYEKLHIVDSDGQTELGAWDPTIEIFPEFGEKTYLYAGVMSRPYEEPYARWPEDNWRRRVNAFEWIEEEGHWQRIEDSIMEDAGPEPTWLGHSYGHSIVRDEVGRVWMFYEKVTHEKQGLPWGTEIFARQMLSPLVLAEEEHPIILLSEESWPATLRNFGGVLAEGPRPFKIGEWFLIGFSAGDYTSENYGIHLLFSKSITGSYQPYLDKLGDNLKDFGQYIEQQHGLTWGAARPSFFEVDGQWWVLFHGIDIEDKEKIERGQRDVYLAPVEVMEHADGPPTIRILVRDEFN